MHRALSLCELISLICENLRRDSPPYRGWQGHLLSYALTCKTFSEVALDFLWSDVRSVKHLLSILPMDDTSDIEHGLTLGSPSDGEWERFRFYSKRIRTLNVDTHLHSQLLSQIERESSPGASFAFPRLSTLSLSLDPLATANAVLHLRSFIRPDITTLAIRGRKSCIQIIADALQYAVPLLPRLRSLQIFADDLSATPLEFSNIQRQLSDVSEIALQLDHIRLPMRLVSEQTISSLASLPNLKKLSIEHPVHDGTFGVLEAQTSDFSSLQKIEANIPLASLGQLLQLHPAFGGISKLSVSCFLPGPVVIRDALAASSFPHLRSPTHLELNFFDVAELNRWDPALGPNFFAPLQSRWRDLVVLHINHAAPLDVDDDELEVIIRHAPKLEVVRLASAPYESFNERQPFRLRVTLACFQLFAKHCPNMRELAIPVNAWTVPAPETAEASFSGPVLLDVSVSPVARDMGSVAHYLAKVFPHRYNRLTCRWSREVWSWDQELFKHDEMDEDGSGSDEDDEDGSRVEDADDIVPPETFLRRWRKISYLMCLMRRERDSESEPRKVMTPPSRRADSARYPSEYWTHSSRDPEHPHTKRLQRVITEGNFSFLSSRALSLREKAHLSDERVVLDDSPSSKSLGTPTCSVDVTKFACGYNNVVFELVFSDSVRWIARVALPDDNLDTTSMLSEMAAMRIVRERISVPVPRIYGYDVDQKNEFGFQYMLMDAIRGCSLTGPFSQTVPPEHRKKIATQLADYYHQISTIRFPEIGLPWCGTNLDEEPTIISFDGPDADYNGPFSSSLEYFYSVRQTTNDQIMEEHPDDDDWTTACWVFKNAIPSMVLEEYIYGPFPLCHLDFHHGNILLDDDFNVVGIVDWSGAQTIPLEGFSIIPELARPPGMSDVRREATTEFCLLFTNALKEKEVESGYRDASHRPLSQIVGTPLMELVYRCSRFPNRLAKWMAPLVLNLLYGDAANWETFKGFYRDSQVKSLFN
ncbi:hypothetical protein JAAARDRAFT_61348 [Jaapia argillacea MUCL 33604]|uniref:Aminoglycoside phosphotransferase domain-containing protein n=1 Tax=Jaapia argillacea MUCL 33604 TaxID=933084 RepID=A0A067PES1_9AGAM|nr:hypothetical protein JAAARDRAFT_61348 [Jaapia argillacea MUCL 33604]